MLESFMEEKIPLLEAYKAMALFLDDYYFRFGQYDVRNILSNIYLFHDGKPADPAAWDDWLDAVKKVLEEEQKNLVEFCWQVLL
jgi:hypothetical protein